jgi:acyl-CoA thioester hydrolase
VSVSQEIDVEIRWPDVDAFGHVSHMALVAIAEHGRSRWLDAILDVAPGTWPYIVAHLEFDFHSPVAFTDRFVRCRFRPLHVGRSSVRLEEQIASPDGATVAQASSVSVAWDAGRSDKRPLSPDERETLCELLERERFKTP